MKIAILDDEAMFAEELKEHICKLDFYNIYSPEICIFNDSGHFFASPVEFDLVFIDYRLENETGMDVAKRIRRADENISIVFVTAFPEYVFDSFKVDAFRYLIKPVKSEDIRETLEAFVSRDTQNRIIKIEEKSSVRYFNISNIMYLETEGRNTNIYTADEKCICKKAISEIEECIDSPWFFRISRFFVVNFLYISRVAKGTVVLKNGTELAVSRNLREQFGKQYIRYLQTKM